MMAGPGLRKYIRLLLAWLCLAGGIVARGEEDSMLILRVDPGHAAARDVAGAGTVEHPYRTIQAAAARAVQEASEGRETRVVIAGGVYREHIVMEGDPDKLYALISLEADGEGEPVVITGAEPRDGWRVGRDGYFELPWSASEGLKPSFYVDGVRVVFRPGARAIGPGQALFDTRRGVVQMLPPRNAVVRVGSVEVAVRATLLEASHLTALNLKRIHFGQARLDAGDEAVVRLSSITEVLLENCRIEHGSLGVDIRGCGGVDLNGLSATRCRGAGAVIRDAGEVMVRGGEFILNGRGSSGAAGMVLHDINTVVMRRTHLAENGRGLLLDGVSVAAELSGLTIYQNQGVGLELEEVADAWLQQVQIAKNGREGILLKRTLLLLENSILANNGRELSAISLGEGARLELSQCILSNDASHAATLLALEHADQYLRGSGNLFYSGQSDEVFRVENQHYDLEAWHGLTGQDGSSFFGDPLFENVDRYDFIPSMGSPWYQRTSWPPVIPSHNDS